MLHHAIFRFIMFNRGYPHQVKYCVREPGGQVTVMRPMFVTLLTTISLNAFWSFNLHSVSVRWIYFCTKYILDK